MTRYKIAITEEAELEIKKAKEWYEEQKPGLGERFAAVIKEHINKLTNPKVDYKIAQQNLRRILIHPFPYVVYYKRHEDRELVEIWAVLHSKQSNNTVKKRIGD